jgi:hypothetical protein
MTAIDRSDRSRQRCFDKMTIEAFPYTTIIYPRHDLGGPLAYRQNRAEPFPANVVDCGLQSMTFPSILWMTHSQMQKWGSTLQNFLQQP